MKAELLKPEESRSDSTVIMVHGYRGTMKRALFRELTKKYLAEGVRVVHVSYKEANEEENIPFRDKAAFLLQIEEKLGEGKKIWVGHSLGRATIAAALHGTSSPKGHVIIGICGAKTVDEVKQSYLNHANVVGEPASEVSETKKDKQGKYLEIPTAWKSSMPENYLEGKMDTNGITTLDFHHGQDPIVKIKSPTFTLNFADSYPPAKLPKPGGNKKVRLDWPAIEAPAERRKPKFSHTHLIEDEGQAGRLAELIISTRFHK